MFLYLVSKVGLKDGFVVGLYFLFLFLGFVEFILGVVSIDSIKNNGYAIVAIVLIALQIISLVVCKIVSNKNKEL